VGYVEDAIITPRGVVNTSPSDYIIATKNPASLGGMNVTINIDRPTVSSQQDIKALTRAIELELYKTQRRYNSYV
jgi:acyl-[acyl carrier protein]--UDP-N-acetylglucosamine O-acyltransferase